MQGLRTLRRTGRVGRPGWVVVVGLVGFVCAVYVLVVIGGGWLTGVAGSPSIVLSVAAAVVVAVAFDPVRRWLSAWTARRFGRPVSAPSQVISRFLAGTATATVPAEATTRMARALVDGLGVETAQVWVRVAGQMRPAGSWPENAEAPDATEPAVRLLTREVRHGGELLGVLSLRTGDGRVLAPVEEKLLDDLTTSAVLVLRNLQLTAELQERYRQTTARAVALTEARRRVVALEDEERRLLERDIHDGAQQQLVALAVNLRVAQARLAKGAEPVPVLAGLCKAVDAATAELRAVVAGRARLIATAGLHAALLAVADTCPVPAHVVSDGLPRYPPEVEQAVYYCCAEALQNVAKHAEASEVIIALRGDRGGVRATVRDDGRGFTPIAGDGPGGHGLRNMVERMAAVGGTLHVHSALGAGTRIELSAPVTVEGTS